MKMNLCVTFFQLIRTSLLMIILIDHSFAFSWKRCHKEWIQSTFGTGVAISTTSFVSSTGACSAIGMNTQDQKKLFVAQNSDKLMEDSARGGGEYLSAYASLSGCLQDGRDKLPVVFQRNFVQIFGDKNPDEPEAINRAMENAIKSDPILASRCWSGS
ncbi:MAG: hypothetical protein A2X86_08070 [Bdellovibrionales bacterium GWA2_49_15]|nr:MAG: hypothetical protein A2X86_08070 [Bdellovibrionales bacterium GWA2_49_15]